MCARVLGKGGHIAKAIKCFHAALFEFSFRRYVRQTDAPGLSLARRHLLLYILFSFSMRLFDILSFEALISLASVL